MPVPWHFRKILVFMKEFLGEKILSLIQTSQENGFSKVLSLTRFICERRYTTDEWPNKSRQHTLGTTHQTWVEKSEVLPYDVIKLCWKCAAGELYALVAVSSKDITLLIMIHYGALKTARFLLYTPFCLKQRQISLLFLQHLIRLGMWNTKSVGS